MQTHGRASAATTPETSAQRSLLYAASDAASCPEHVLSVGAKTHVMWHQSGWRRWRRCSAFRRRLVRTHGVQAAGPEQAAHQCAIPP